jgi:hypothetical protein
MQTQRHPPLSPMKVCKQEYPVRHYCALPPVSTYLHARYIVKKRKWPNSHAISRLDCTSVARLAADSNCLHMHTAM